MTEYHTIVEKNELLNIILVTAINKNRKITLIVPMYRNKHILITDTAVNMFMIDHHIKQNIIDKHEKVRNSIFSENIKSCDMEEVMSYVNYCTCSSQIIAIEILTAILYNNKIDYMHEVVDDNASLFYPNVSN